MKPVFFSMQVCNNKVRNDCWQRGGKPWYMTSVSLAMRRFLFCCKFLPYLFDCFSWVRNVPHRLMLRACDHLVMLHLGRSWSLWDCVLTSRSCSQGTSLESEPITGSKLRILFSGPEMWTCYKLLLPLWSCLLHHEGLGSWKLWA